MYGSRLRKDELKSGREKRVEGDITHAFQRTTESDVLPYRATIRPQRGTHMMEECLALVLLRAWRKIRSEALAVYYGTNTFQFEYDRRSDTLSQFFQSLGASKVALCTSISVRGNRSRHLNGWCPRRCRQTRCCQELHCQKPIRDEGIWAPVLHVDTRD